MLQKDQKGFSAVEGLLIVVLVGLISLVGWYVWKNQADKSVKTDSSSSTIVNTKKATKKIKEVSQGDYVNVIQEDTSITNVSPNKIAKTTDQALILQALHETCADKNASSVTVNHAVFEGDVNFKQEGGYAEINASKCDPKVTNLDDLGAGSGSAIYLRKNADGNWKVDFATQMGVFCKQVDSKGYPTSVVPSCFSSDDGTTTRAPK